MSRRAARPRIAIVGMGRVGTALAMALEAGRLPVTAIASRRRSSAARAARALRGAAGARVIRRIDELPHDADVIILCVPDDEIPRAVETLGGGPGAPVSLAGKVVLHTSGAAGPSALAPLRRLGARVGCLHPLLSFPPAGSARPDLHDVVFALDGDREAMRAARRLVEALGGVPIKIGEADRAVYHLAASLVAGGCAAILDAGTELLTRRVRLGERRARAALLRLVRSALLNVAGSGARAGLTGPVARGDARTIVRHLEALDDEEPDLAALYRLISLRAVTMAFADGRLDVKRAASLTRLLRHPGRSSRRGAAHQTPHSTSGRTRRH